MLIRQTLRYLPAQLLAPAFQLLSMVAWTYWLAPKEMGTFVLVSATQEFVALVALSWFSVYALRFMPFEQSREARADYMRTESSILWLSLPLSALAAVATAAVLGGQEFSWQSIAIISFFFVTRGTNVHFSERARAQSRVLAYTALQTVGPVVGFGLGVLLLETVAATSDMLLLAYGAAQLLATLIAAPMLGTRILPGRIRGSIVRAAIAYGGPVLLLSALGWIAENNFRYIIEHAAGAATFGLMAVGWGLGRRCASFGCMLVTAAAFPIAARLLNEGRRQEAMEQLSVNAALLFGVMAPTVVGLMLVGEPATELLIAPEYREMTAAILGLSALAGAIRFLHVHVTDQLFVLDRRFAFAGIVDVVEIAGTVALTLAGLALYGPIGAVIGSAAGSALATATSVSLAVFGMGFRLPFGDIARILLANAAMAAVLLLLPPIAGVGALVLAVLVGMAVYAAAIALAYRGQVRAILERRLPRQRVADAV